MRYRLVDKGPVCKPGYASSVRNVPESRKDDVYRAHAMKQHFNGRNGEVDHLVSLELGGTNATANLFPEAASPRPASQEKDRLENRLHDLVCSGQISLRPARDCDELGQGLQGLRAPNLAVADGRFFAGRIQEGHVRPERRGYVRGQAGQGPVQR